MKMLTIFLRHDEMNQHVKRTGWLRNFPPPGVEIVSWNVRMGNGAATVQEKRSLTARLIMVGALSSHRAYTHDGSWPTTAAALTESQTATLREDLNDLVKTSVGYTVGEMRLTRTAPRHHGGRIAPS